MDRIVVLFPGQGAQYVGMGSRLYDFPVVKRIFEEASDVLGLDIRKLCFEGPTSSLKQTMFAQPAVVTVSVAAFELLMQEADITPVFSAGHSLGEYSALICSGALSFRDGLEIVRQRGLLMQDAASKHPGTMIAVADMEHVKLEAWCREFNEKEKPLVIACCNTERQHVIAGHRDSIERMIKKLDYHSVRYSNLEVSGPFHSPLMKQAADRLIEPLRKSRISAPRWPVVSNVDASPYSDVESIVDGLIRQMTFPVRWHETTEFLIRQGVTRMIEVGPGRVLSNMLKVSTYRGGIHRFDHNEDLAELVKAVNGAQRDDPGTNRERIERSLANAIIMRNRSYDPGQFQKGVIDPIDQVMKLLKQNPELTAGQTRAAMDLIQQIMDTKNGTIEGLPEVHI